MTIAAGLNDFDLSYTPPFSSPWDPVPAKAQGWMSGRENANRSDSVEAEANS